MSSEECSASAQIVFPPWTHLPFQSHVSPHLFDDADHADGRNYDDGQWFPSDGVENIQKCVLYFGGGPTWLKDSALGGDSGVGAYFGVGLVHT